MEGKLDAKIDQVAQTLEMNRLENENVDLDRYVALEKLSNSTRQLWENLSVRAC